MPLPIAFDTPPAPANEPLTPKTALEVWGILIRYFRKNGITDILSLLNEQKNYTIENDELIITTNDDTYLRFSDDKVLAKLEQAIKELNLSLKIKIQKDKTNIDMDKEIEKLRKFGIDPKIVK